MAAKKKRSKLELWLRRKKRARAKAKAAKQQKTFNKMDIILVIIAVALLAFTVEMIHLYKETGMIPDTLVTCVFAALGGECGAMAWIKTAKERFRDRVNQLEDQKHMEEREDAMSQNNGGTNDGTERNDQ